MADLTQYLRGINDATAPVAAGRQQIIDPSRQNRLGLAPAALPTGGALTQADLNSPAFQAIAGPAVAPTAPAAPTLAAPAVVVPPATAVAPARRARSAALPTEIAAAPEAAAGPVEVIRGLRRTWEGAGPARPYNGETPEQVSQMYANERAASGGNPQYLAGKFLDPRNATDRAFAMQNAQQQSIRDEYFDRVGGGDLFSTKTMAGALAPVYAPSVGSQNQGSVVGQGVNTFNAAQAGIAQAGIGAGAQIYGANAGLTANLANTNMRMYEVGTTPVPSGTTLLTDPVTGLGVPGTTYSQRPAQIGGMPQSSRPAVVPQVGGSYNAPDGNYGNVQVKDKKIVSVK